MPGARARKAVDISPIVTSSTTSNHQTGTPRRRRTLWQPSDSGRVEGPRPRGEPRSHRAIDAPSRYQGHHGAATPGADHRQPSRLPDRAEPDRAELQLRRAEPNLAGRHHLHRDRSRLALSGHCHGFVQPQDRRLGDGGSFASRPAADSLADGHFDAAAWCRPDPPLQSRRSIAPADYRKLLQSAGFRASMSRKADCYDNAPMESFFHTLKTELVHHRHYATRTEATRDIFAYIEGFYNRTRRHSAIGYISPSEMELKAA